MGLRDVLEDFYLLLHPRPAYAIGSGRWGERINFMAASWVTPVAEEPPRVAVAIGTDSFTHELIKRYKEFTVNVLPLELLDALYLLGCVSGRDRDKLAAAGLSAEKGEKVEAPVLKEAIGVLECRVVAEVESEDTTLFIGDVLAAKAREDVFTDSGWDFKATNLPLHNWGRGFYSVGRFRLARKPPR